MELTQKAHEFDTQKFLTDPLMVATGCSWRRIIHSSGKPSFMPTNDAELGFPTIEAEEETLSIFAASPTLFVSTLLLLDRLQAAFDPKLSVDDGEEILNYAKHVLNSAIDSNYSKPSIDEIKLLNDSPFVKPNNQAVLLGLQNPFHIDKGDNKTIGTHINSLTGKRICSATNHPVDNHPELASDLTTLHLFAAAPELFEATRWLISRLDRALENKSIADAPDVFSFSQMALKKSFYAS